MDTDLQATDPSLQFMTSGVLDTTFYATYKKWLLYRTQDLNLYVAMVVMAIAVALISIFSRSWYVIPAGVVFIADVIEGEDSMALLTRANALIPVFTSQLTESEKEHLLALLAEKAPKCKHHRA